MSNRLREDVRKTTRVYLDAQKSEWMDVDTELLGKMRMLLRMQPDSVHDLEHYFEKADAVQGSNCHKTALYLTDKMSLEKLFAHTNHDVQHAGHEYVANEENTGFIDSSLNIRDVARNVIARKSYPFRITFFEQTRSGLFPQHSITIIGVTNKGSVKGFEKKDAYADHPFQDIDVLETIAYYQAKGYRIGVQK